MTIIMMARRTELVTIVAILWILLLLTTTTTTTIKIVPVSGLVYGLPEEEEEIFKYFENLNTAIRSPEIRTPYEIPYETLEAIKKEATEIGFEIVSNPEFYNEFKALYNSTDGFTKNFEEIGEFMRQTLIKIISTHIEKTSVPFVTEKFPEFLSTIQKEPTNTMFINLFKHKVLGLPQVLPNTISEETTTMYNYTEPEAGGSTLEEQLKLAQKKLEEAGVHGEYGVASQVPAESEQEINMEKVRSEIMLLKILLEQIDSRLTSLEQELHLD